MRSWHRYVALALVVSACSGSDATTTDAPRTTAAALPAPSSSTTSGSASTSTAPSSTAASSTAPTPTSTATTSSATTPTAPPGDPATSTSVDLANIPSCADQPEARVCIGVTVPPPPDAAVILDRYRAFAQKHLEVQSNPDAPDWAGLEAFIVPDLRDDARAEIAERFGRGEALNVSLGVQLDPRISPLPFPDGYLKILDCRVDGSYWTDRATSAPVAGEVPEARPRTFVATMERFSGVWYLSAYSYGSGRC